jgi:hypothetical protein
MGLAQQCLSNRPVQQRLTHLSRRREGPRQVLRQTPAQRQRIRPCKDMGMARQALRHAALQLRMSHLSSFPLTAKLTPAVKLLLQSAAHLHRMKLQARRTSWPAVKLPMSGMPQHRMEALTSKELLYRSWVVPQCIKSPAWKAVLHKMSSREEEVRHRILQRAGAQGIRCTAARKMYPTMRWWRGCGSSSTHCGACR